MSSYAKNKLQMCSVTNISVDIAKYVQNVHKFAQNTHFLSVTTKMFFLILTEQSSLFC